MFKYFHSTKLACTCNLWSNVLYNSTGYQHCPNHYFTIIVVQQIKLSQMLVFDEGGKSEYPGKTFSEQSREPTNSIHIWCRECKLNPGHIGGRQVISPRGHPCHPLKGVLSELDSTQVNIPCFFLDHQDYTLLFSLSLCSSQWISCGRVENSTNLQSVERFVKIPSSTEISNYYCSLVGKSNMKNAGLAQTEKQNSGQHIPTSPPRWNVALVGFTRASASTAAISPWITVN